MKGESLLGSVKKIDILDPASGLLPFSKQYSSENCVP